MNHFLLVKGVELDADIMKYFCGKVQKKSGFRSNPRMKELLFFTSWDMVAATNKRRP